MLNCLPKNHFTIPPAMYEGSSLPSSSSTLVIVFFVLAILVGEHLLWGQRKLWVLESGQPPIAHPSPYGLFSVARPLICIHLDSRVLLLALSLSFPLTEAPLSHCALSGHATPNPTNLKPCKATCLRSMAAVWSLSCWAPTSLAVGSSPR